MCTSDSTFSITLVESSNTLLLLEAVSDTSTDAADAENVSAIGSNCNGVAFVARGSVNGIHELKRVAPPLHTLRELLERDPFDGSEEDPDDAMSCGSGSRVAHTMAGAASGSTSALVSASESLGAHDVEMSGAGRARGGAGSRVAGAHDTQSTARSGGRGFTSAQFLSDVRCSELELYDGLASLGALEISGRWRLLDAAYAKRVLIAALNLMVEYDWSPDALPLTDVADLLVDQFPSEVVMHVLRQHSIDTSATAGSPTTALSFAKVAKALAGDVWRALAKNAAISAATAAGGAAAAPDSATIAAQYVPAPAFIRAWSSAVPLQMQTGVPGVAPATPLAAAATASRGVLSLELLRGEVLTETLPSGVPAVRYFPSAELSHDPGRRFAQLFAARAKWHLPDLEPFLTPLVGYGRTLDTMLLAHTRTTLLADNKTRIFSKR